MTGTVIRVRRRGVEVQLDSAGTPVGQWDVVRASDGSVACVVAPHRSSLGIVNGWKFNWVGNAPGTLPAVGDSLRPVGS